MVTIEKNHELLDIILGYKPDIIPADCVTIIFECNVTEGLSFTLTSPSGIEYVGIGTYKLKEIGTWSVSAYAEGYSSYEDTIIVKQEDFGNNIQTYISLQRISGDVLVKGKGYTIDVNRDESLINYSLINIFTGHQEENYYVLNDQSSIVNGNYQYYKDFDSYYYNDYSKDGFYTLSYFYKTYNSNIQELGDVKLLSNEYDLSNTSSEIIVYLKDITTGGYVQGKIYCKSYLNYGYQDHINPNFDTWRNSWEISNPTGEHYLNIDNNGSCYFTLRFWGDYYEETFINITAVPGNWQGEPLDVYLTPKLKADGLKAVLTWGSVPNDLDSHLKAYNNGNEISHIFYNNKQYIVDNVVHIDLDVDDTSSYGPETTSIYVRDDNFMYYYYIFDFSGTDGIPEDAVITLYSEGRLLFTITPDSLNRHNSSYRYWKVFSYNANTQDIRIINKIVNYEPNENNWEE